MAFKNLKTRDIILILVTVFSLLVPFSFARVGQNPVFHNFADQREFLGIPNFFNVVTNLPFVLIGLFALLLLGRRRGVEVPQPSSIILFVSVVAIGLGSAWYHYNPENASLVWDRIPMTLTFMSYFSIIVGSYVNETIGKKMLFPMLVLGVATVCYWFISEQNGNGDLRPYLWVQFYPMVCIPLIVFLYPTPKDVKIKIISVIAVYALAKVAEHEDHSIYTITFLSGHSLKHLLASLSVFLILLTASKKPAL